ncbi:putative intracellular sulfur oxidation protein [Pectobacterium atrosepticum SCRI1043]|uniref:Protein TusB n=1 Tax=Pectobacterium atrosepticum (strain SCRI 1043 / ATCC BAA-672) TaxID=218491 RepID=TUSB_PECAS|nr:sulfurtransferase complex subunit TusB [Pectobacterium atrosepticum]Q6CZW2.1 RecName: Full=Protein TusB; AltName: Full=tRNA 2-thiouridine synthesizing protein B [Pectobacterium atrosepticum SCRI1043]GKV87276.1 protein TusB [Pectobacterium carotovorum subsp. carotovorum]AIA72815.1 sulfur transfer complex subunit TusB [Pectobacterium atrosepticum]AIK15799.1 putative intracellular sulfur oxidation protein [Pectobacterium atrosepticum]ATY92483.1 sulfurtransferase TusB [Pectobacterium atroseptic
MLHTLSCSPYHADLDTLLRSLEQGDALVLLQDGVIAALVGGDIIHRLLDSAVLLYALRPDTEARGMTEQISNSVVLIGYNEFVQLTVEHPQQLAW